MKKQIDVGKLGGPLGFCLLIFIFLGCSSASNRQDKAENRAFPVFAAGDAYAHLVRQCDFGPRIPGTPGHIQCRDYLIENLKKFSRNVTKQPFQVKFGTPEVRAEAYNIIARFQPEKSPRLLLCAHWDTRPWADQDPSPSNRLKPVTGASDGASGVAVLLEIARILDQNPPPIGVDIVLFDGEDAGKSGSDEDWIQGSTFFAKNLSRSDYPRFGILLDMIGDADLNLPKEAHSWYQARSYVDKVWEVAAEMNLKAFQPEVKYQILDDHLPLLEAGIPCIDLIDFDYPHWHTISDTPDKCSPASLDQVGRLIVRLIYDFKNLFK